LKLPSKSTLYKFFKNIPFETGINEEIFLKLKTRIEKMKPIEKICKLMFDEMTLSTDLTYSKSDDKIVGYEDLGSLGRNKNLANHSLVFMVLLRPKNFVRHFQGTDIKCKLPLSTNNLAFLSLLSF
jgi:hypothetical protein